MKRHSQQLFQQRGFLILEPFIVLLFFSIIIILVNNGVVHVIQKEWYSTVKSAAIAGGQKLLEEEENPDANQAAVNEAMQIALLHRWFDRPVQVGQITVTLGEWSNCIFTENGEPTNAVRVDITPPVDEGGSPTGITAIFGRFQAPMLATFSEQITAVAAVMDSSVVLVEYQGAACVQ